MENVHRLTDQIGHPETEFERDAVEGLLSAIRKFRTGMGRDPQALAFLLVADGPEPALRCGHVRLAGPSPRMVYAYAATVMQQAALGA